MGTPRGDLSGSRAKQRMGKFTPSPRNASATGDEKFKTASPGSGNSKSSDKARKKLAALKQSESAMSSASKMLGDEALAAKLGLDVPGLGGVGDMSLDYGEFSVDEVEDFMNAEWMESVAVLNWRRDEVSRLLEESRKKKSDALKKARRNGGDALSGVVDAATENNIFDLETEVEAIDAQLGEIDTSSMKTEDYKARV